MARADMRGLTKEMIERLLETDSEANLNFKRSAVVFERGARVAARESRRAFSISSNYASPKRIG
jgi:hypothetical protein